MASLYRTYRTFGLTAERAFVAARFTDRYVEVTGPARQYTLALVAASFATLSPTELLSIYEGLR